MTGLFVYQHQDEVPRRRAALAPLPSTWRAAGEARLRRYKPKDHGRHLLKQTAPGDSNDLRVSRQGLASCIARGSGAGHAAAAGVPNDGSRISNCKEGLDQAGSGARGGSSQIVRPSRNHLLKKSEECL